MMSEILPYVRAEIVTTGFLPEHKYCKRFVENVELNQDNEWQVQLGECMGCSSPASVPPLNYMWVRR